MGAGAIVTAAVIASADEQVAGPEGSRDCAGRMTFVVVALILRITTKTERPSIGGPRSARINGGDQGPAITPEGTSDQAHSWAVRPGRCWTIDTRRHRELGDHIGEQPSTAAALEGRRTTGVEDDPVKAAAEGRRGIRTPVTRGRVGPLVLLSLGWRFSTARRRTSRARRADQQMHMFGGCTGRQQLLDRLEGLTPTQIKLAYISSSPAVH